jgi:hypothetical protein
MHRGGVHGAAMQVVACSGSSEEVMSTGRGYDTPGSAAFRAGGFMADFSLYYSVIRGLSIDATYPRDVFPPHSSKEYAEE